MMLMEKNEISRRILKLQSEITFAILNGHKSHDDDKFENHRQELMKLRCLLFGEDSKICKTEKLNCRNCDK